MKPVILIVDDSSADQHLAGSLLQKQFCCDVEYAWNGDAALKRIEQQGVDVVVTDLVMPGLDGLGLVQTLRDHHSRIPVLLMTAFGNEEVAAEALAVGASSYVPKSQLAERLVLTVQRLVNRAMTDRCRNFAGKRMLGGAFRFELNHDLFMIVSIVNLLHRTMSSMELGIPSQRIRACTALEEAISNAILHGNLEICEDELAQLRRSHSQTELNRVIERRGRQPEFRDRRVLVDAEIHRDYAKMTVSDQGNGFDWASRNRFDLRDRFDAGKDRGLMLMHTLVDNLSFNDTANEVTLATLTAINTEPLL
ncbi:response regulator [Stieleria sp. TO1_6]|uniref:ATP-binding response regulator n=1 Tax=Stieleria tagensis TaxID=2956795 RepID=UPI00209AE0AA|nr:response regulator [Stieleria tagensis]MCO8121703.1 response regulator [Stieleria tagensis]